jgi:predicted transcriptional regulator
MMNRFRKWIFKQIIADEVKQGFDHSHNIVEIFDMVNEAILNEFVEDSPLGLKNYLTDLYSISVRKTICSH